MEKKVLSNEDITNYVTSITRTVDFMLKNGSAHTGALKTFLSYESTKKIIDTALSRIDEAYGRPKHPLILDIQGAPGFGYLYAKSTRPKIDYKIQELGGGNIAIDIVAKISKNNVIPLSVVQPIALNSELFYKPPPTIVIIEPRIERLEKSDIIALKKRILEGIKGSGISYTIIVTGGDFGEFGENIGLTITSLGTLKVDYLSGGSTLMNVIKIEHDHTRKKRISPKRNVPKEKAPKEIIEVHSSPEKFPEVPEQESSDEEVSLRKKKYPGSIGVRQLSEDTIEVLYHPGYPIGSHVIVLGRNSPDSESDDEKYLRDPRVVKVFTKIGEIKEPKDFKTDPQKHPRYLGDLAGDVYQTNYNTIIDFDDELSELRSEFKVILDDLKGIKEFAIPEKLETFKNENSPITTKIIPYSKTGIKTFCFQL